MVTYNSIMAERWQIVSDDSVWMFHADTSLSTVELNPEIYKIYRYESCLFFANGDSDVVRRYETKEEALVGHEELEKKYGLKRCTELKIWNSLT
jgi:hypothetical protein